MRQKDQVHESAILFKLKYEQFGQTMKQYIFGKYPFILHELDY